MTDNLVVTHNYGLFSCCTVRLKSIIDYYNSYKSMPVVNSTMQFGSYKDIPGDITYRLFKNTYSPLHDNNLEIIPSNQQLDYNINNWLQYSDYSQINYTILNDLIIGRYFLLSDEITDIKKQLINKYNINLNKTIAVCYRGTDKRTETLVPSYKEIIDKIYDIKIKNPDHQILLQTDEKECFEFICKYFPNLIYFNETIRLPKHSRAAQYYLKNGKKLKYAQNFLAISKTLSDCDYLITNSGNVGLWLCLYRNNFKKVSQYLNSYWIEKYDYT